MRCSFPTYVIYFHVSPVLLEHGKVSDCTLAWIFELSTSVSHVSFSPSVFLFGKRMRDFWAVRYASEPLARAISFQLNSKAEPTAICESYCTSIDQRHKLAFSLVTFDLHLLYESFAVWPKSSFWNEGSLLFPIKMWNVQFFFLNYAL